MLRCTYRLTDTRTVVARGKVDRLPHKGDLINLDNERYIVEKVQQEGPSATISVSIDANLGKN